MYHAATIVLYLVPSLWSESFQHLALLYASYDYSLWKRCPVLAREFPTLSQRYSVIPVTN